MTQAAEKRVEYDYFYKGVNMEYLERVYAKLDGKMEKHDQYCSSADVKLRNNREFHIQRVVSGDFTRFQIFDNEPNLIAEFDSVDYSSILKYEVAYFLHVMAHKI